MLVQRPKRGNGRFWVLTSQAASEDNALTFCRLELAVEEAGLSTKQTAAPVLKCKN